MRSYLTFPTSTRDGWLNAIAGLVDRRVSTCHMQHKNTARFVMHKKLRAKTQISAESRAAWRIKWATWREVRLVFTYGSNVDTWHVECSNDECLLRRSAHRLMHNLTTTYRYAPKRSRSTMTKGCPHIMCEHTV